MNLLIIGGTRMVGRHLVAAARARGHSVTLFNRGQHRNSAFAGVETILGDRNRDLARLEGRRWDAVIDTCGYLPDAVRASATALADSVERYVFISSISIYADLSTRGIDEAAPLTGLTDEQARAAERMDRSGEISATTYGDAYSGLKARCEKAVEKCMPGRVLTLRPGLIVGTGDYSDRFTYWVARIARGGKVLAPGRSDRPLQLIDAADLADWAVRMVEREKTGVYNVSGSANALTMASLLEECKTAAGSDASFIWTDDAFLLQHRITPWSEMPLWLPENDPALRGFMQFDCSKALAAGLEFRPIGQTVRDVLTWHQSERPHGPLKAGLEADKEKHLLRMWQRAAPTSAY